MQGFFPKLICYLETVFRKTSQAECRQQGNHLRWNIPVVVPKANKLEVSLSNFICQKPKLTSNFENCFAPNI